MIDWIEETFIAATLGIMALITFANVVARYVFNSNILWALETTVFLFAWLVLIGASYCVRKNAHLGVDVVVKALPAGTRRAVSLVAAACSLLFAILVLYGAWTYWMPFAGERAWYEVDDIAMPEFLQFLSASMNEGERWEKLPRFIPYFCLPLGFALLVLRTLQAGIRIFTGEQELLIASHEAEEMLEENKS
jgi:C4-dicarboxylate transporter DctQ subunit